MKRKLDKSLPFFILVFFILVGCSKKKSKVFDSKSSGVLDSVNFEDTNNSSEVLPKGLNTLSLEDAQKIFNDYKSKILKYNIETAVSNIEISNFFMAAKKILQSDSSLISKKAVEGFVKNLLNEDCFKSYTCGSISFLHDNYFFRNILFLLSDSKEIVPSFEQRLFYSNLASDIYTRSFSDREIQIILSHVDELPNVANKESKHINNFEKNLNNILKNFDFDSLDSSSPFIENIGSYFSQFTLIDLKSNVLGLAPDKLLQHLKKFKLLDNVFSNKAVSEYINNTEFSKNFQNLYKTKNYYFKFFDLSLNADTFNNKIFVILDLYRKGLIDSAETDQILTLLEVPKEEILESIKLISFSQFIINMDNNFLDLAEIIEKYPPSKKTNIEAITLEGMKLRNNWMEFFEYISSNRKLLGRLAANSFDSSSVDKFMLELDKMRTYVEKYVSFPITLIMVYYFAKYETTHEFTFTFFGWTFRYLVKYKSHVQKLFSGALNAYFNYTPSSNQIAAPVGIMDVIASHFFISQLNILDPFGISKKEFSNVLQEAYLDSANQEVSTSDNRVDSYERFTNVFERINDYFLDKSSSFVEFTNQCSYLAQYYCDTLKMNDPICKHPVKNYYDNSKLVNSISILLGELKHKAFLGIPAKYMGSLEQKPFSISQSYHNVFRFYVLPGKKAERIEFGDHMYRFIEHLNRDIVMKLKLSNIMLEYLYLDPVTNLISDNEKEEYLFLKKQIVDDKFLEIQNAMETIVNKEDNINVCHNFLTKYEKIVRKVTIVKEMDYAKAVYDVALDLEPNADKILKSIGTKDDFIKDINQSPWLKSIYYNRPLDSSEKITEEDSINPSMLFIDNKSYQFSQLDVYLRMQQYIKAGLQLPNLDNLTQVQKSILGVDLLDLISKNSTAKTSLFPSGFINYNIPLYDDMVDLKSRSFNIDKISISLDELSKESFVQKYLSSLFDGYFPVLTWLLDFQDGENGASSIGRTNNVKFRYYLAYYNFLEISKNFKKLPNSLLCKSSHNEECNEIGPEYIMKKAEEHINSLSMSPEDISLFKYLELNSPFNNDNGLIANFYNTSLVNIVTDEGDSYLKYVLDSRSGHYDNLFRLLKEDALINSMVDNSKKNLGNRSIEIIDPEEMAGKTSSTIPRTFRHLPRTLAREFFGYCKYERLNQLNKSFERPFNERLESFTRKEMKVFWERKDNLLAAINKEWEEDLLTNNVKFFPHAVDDVLEKHEDYSYLTSRQEREYLAFKNEFYKQTSGVYENEVPCEEIESLL